MAFVEIHHCELSETALTVSRNIDHEPFHHSLLWDLTILHQQCKLNLSLFSIWRLIVDFLRGGCTQQSRTKCTP
jgi:hypothetical protein